MKKDFNEIFVFPKQFMMFAQFLCRAPENPLCHHCGALGGKRTHTKGSTPSGIHTGSQEHKLLAYILQRMYFADIK